MRTTVDLPDELLKAARARAVRDNTTLTALLSDGLRLRLERSESSSTRSLDWPIIRGAGGLRPHIDPNSNKSMLDAADDLL